MKKNEVSDGIPREIPRMALLIVDDVEINRSILKEMLSEQYMIYLRQRMVGSSSDSEQKQKYRCCAFGYFHAKGRWV